MAHAWFTTAPHPYKSAHKHSADQNQVGWRLHLADLSTEQADAKGRNRAVALCGLRPKHGWGLDLFIDAPCARCIAKAEKLNIKLPPI